MSQRDLLLMTAPIREALDIPYHELGPPSLQPAVALVAGLHGDELNGTFVLARLADFLNGVEAGRFPKLKLLERVLVVPAVNVTGINSRSRSWPFDKTDLNRMFPGNVFGETTQRIACAVLEATRKARYRLDLHSSSLDFEELPQVRLYASTPEERATARLFGLPAVMERSVSPVFTSTLLYSWKYWPGQSFLLQIGHAGNIQLPHCQRVFMALVAFLGRVGVLAGVDLAEEEEEVLYFGKESALKLYADRAGMFVSDRQVGQWVRPGQELGYIYDSFHGNVHTKVTAPAAGIITGIRRGPLLFEGDLLVRLNRKMA